MKKAKKTLLIFSLVGIMIIGSAMMAYAQTVNWYFSIPSNTTRVSLSTEAVKADWEQTAYITPTSGNVTGYSMNVRFASGSTSTRYTNFVTVSNNYSTVTTAYTKTGTPGHFITYGVQMEVHIIQDQEDGLHKNVAFTNVNAIII